MLLLLLRRWTEDGVGECRSLGLPVILDPADRKGNDEAQAFDVALLVPTGVTPRPAPLPPFRSLPPVCRG
jgi:hypothetical protein